MKNNFKPVPRKENVVIQELGGEVLIYDLKTNKAHCLNETSALVWQACDGDRNVSDITKQVSEKLNAPATDDLVWLALDQFKKDELIVNGSEINGFFGGMSRREVIRNVGLASVIALPLVSSLVAPKAASAASVAPAACNTADAGDTFIGGTCPQNCAGAACNTTTGQGTPGRCLATGTPGDSICTR